MSDMPEKRTSRDRDGRLQWQRLAAELRQRTGRMPVRLAEAERCYAQSTPIPIESTWIQSIQSAVRETIAHRQATHARGPLDELTFTTQIWQPHTADAIRSHCVYQMLDESIAPRLTSCPGQRTEFAASVSRRDMATDPNVADIHDIWAIPAEEWAHSLHELERAPAQWDVYSDGDQWHCTQLAMPVDPGAPHGALATYREQHWWEN